MDSDEVEDPDEVKDLNDVEDPDEVVDLYKVKDLDKVEDPVCDWCPRITSCLLAL